MYTMDDFWEELSFLLAGVILGMGWAWSPPPGIPRWAVIIFALPWLGCGILAHICGEGTKERLRGKRS
jgi:hypothetical protein